LAHIAANCTLFDEELIEFLNAKASSIMNVPVCVPATNHFRTQIGRWFNPRTPNVNIDHYKKTVGYIKGVEAIQKMLDELLLKRKGHGSEQERLRKAYLQPKWAHTNAEYRKFVTGLFEKALDGDDVFKNSWPDVDRFAVGMERIKSDGAKGIINGTSGLATWAKKQERLRAPAPAAN
jgi:hypothetical protein